MRMNTYSFVVLGEDPSCMLSKETMKAPTRSEARGWLKKRLRSEGVYWTQIVSIKAAPSTKGGR